MGFCPFWKQTKKLSNAIISLLTGQISRGFTIVPQLFLSSHGIYIIFFPKMKKTKNRLVWVINHVPLYTIKPLWTKASQTSWLLLEVVHLLLRKNYQKKKYLNFYHIPKPIFYFSNVELNKKKLFCKENFQTFISQ